MELTKEEKDLINNQVDEKIKDFKMAIYVLNTYKWLGGILLAVLGVGSFWGVNEYIDRKITDRIKLYDNYYFALTSVNNRNTKVAYAALTSSYNEINKAKFEVSDDFKKSYFQNILFILQELDDTEVSYDLQYGSYTWNELKKDKDFLKFKEGLSSDPFGLVNYSLCEAKYESPNFEVLERSKKGYLRAIELVGDESIEDKVGWYFYLMQFCLLNNELSKAKEYVKQIQNSSFRDYDMYKKESKEFEKTIYGRYWAGLYKRYNPDLPIDAFYRNYKRLYQ